MSIVTALAAHFRGEAVRALDPCADLAATPAREVASTQRDDTPVRHTACMWLYLGCVLVMTGLFAVIGWIATPTRNRLSCSGAVAIVVSAASIIWSAITTDLARLVLLAILPGGWIAMTLTSRARLARTGARDGSAQPGQSH